MKFVRYLLSGTLLSAGGFMHYQLHSWGMNILSVEEWYNLILNLIYDPDAFSTPLLVTTVSLSLIFPLAGFLVFVLGKRFEPKKVSGQKKDEFEGKRFARERVKVQKERGLKPIGFPRLPKFKLPGFSRKEGLLHVGGNRFEAIDRLRGIKFPFGGLFADLKEAVVSIYFSLIGRFPDIGFGQMKRGNSNSALGKAAEKAASRMGIDDELLPVNGDPSSGSKLTDDAEIVEGVMAWFGLWHLEVNDQKPAKLFEEAKRLSGQISAQIEATIIDKYSFQGVTALNEIKGASEYMKGGASVPKAINKARLAESLGEPDLDELREDGASGPIEDLEAEDEFIEEDVVVISDENPAEGLIKSAALRINDPQRNSPNSRPYDAMEGVAIEIPDLDEEVGEGIQNQSISTVDDDVSFKVEQAPDDPFAEASGHINSESGLLNVVDDWSLKEIEIPEDYKRTQQDPVVGEGDEPDVQADEFGSNELPDEEDVIDQKPDVLASGYSDMLDVPEDNFDDFVSGVPVETVEKSDADEDDVGGGDTPDDDLEDEVQFVNYGYAETWGLAERFADEYKDRAKASKTESYRSIQVTSSSEDGGKLFAMVDVMVGDLRARQKHKLKPHEAGMIGVVFVVVPEGDWEVVRRIDGSNDNFMIVGVDEAKGKALSIRDGDLDIFADWCEQRGLRSKGVIHFVFDGNVSLNGVGIDGDIQGRAQSVFNSEGSKVLVRVDRFEDPDWDEMLKEYVFQK